MEPRTAAQFAPGVIDASRAVLVELGVMLRSYLRDLVLIGGWAPYFLLQQHQQAGFDHVGSIDIDLAVHPRIAERGGYASIAKLPDAGGEATVTWQMANLAASLVMKSLALGGRYKEKDAYDLFYLVRHYQQGPASAAEALRPLLHLPVVQQARKNLQEAFGSLHATGPAWIANFNDLTEPRARDILIADVYKTFERFFQLLS